MGKGAIKCSMKITASGVRWNDRGDPYSDETAKMIDEEVAQ